MSLSTNFPNIRPSLLLDFANSKTLDPRITFTRASTATYYDGVTTAKAEQNLLTYSQDLGNAIYGFTNLTHTANSTAAPDGTTTAALVAETTANNVHLFQYLNTTGGFPTVSGSQYVFSFFAKKGPGGTAPDWVRFRFVDYFNNVYANFNITTLSAGLTSNCTASVTNVGNGWVRCVAVATASTTSGNNRVEIEFTNNTDSATVPTYTGATTSNMYIWGLQVEQRSSVTAYTATTSQPITNYIPVLLTAAAGVPRFDHNPITEESLGLLIEESRTNLLINSEQINLWSLTNTTVTVNQMVAPDGALSADAVAGSSSSSNQKYVNANAAVSTTGAYTASVFLKAGTQTQVVFRANDQTGVNGSRVLVDLSAGTVGAVVNDGTNTGGVATISSVGNNWYRVTLTSTFVSAFTQINLNVWFDNYGSSTSTNTFYIWGAQLEAGAFATSYIPTAATQVTRQADAASMTGTNFSSWWRQDEGAFYAEAKTEASNVSTALSVGGILQIDNGSNTGNRYLFDITGSTSVRTYVEPGGYSASASANTFNGFKAAFGYSSSPLSISANGTAASTAALAVNQALMTRMTIGNIGNTTWFLSGTIKKIAYYPARLTNAQLQSLTR